MTLSAKASGLAGGELVVCSEYGRVEIVDSDDDQVRLQVRWDAFGEGAGDPGAAARRAIEETSIRAYIASRDRQLLVRVWHPVLGFTAGGQATQVSVRLQVPAGGAYHVRTEAFHGLVAVRRLTLAGARLRGAVGEKFKGIPGFSYGTALDDVTLAGDVDIDNLAGLPGIRAPVAPELSHLSAPIFVRARVAASGRLIAVTGGDISIAIQPHPELGVRALGESNDDRLRVAIDGGTATEPGGESSYRVRRQAESSGFQTKPLRLVIHATSGPGRVHIASIPSAPLPRRPARDGEVGSHGLNSATTAPSTGGLRAHGLRE
jgi:hypothetical protein